MSVLSLLRLRTAAALADRYRIGVAYVAGVADDAWMREIAAIYGLDGTLFGLWERFLRAERARLEPAAP
ncbi:MAG: hypothetical protein J07HN4v3_02522 [Halonotius sp. J07HN4]|nr:MAG: hypothetical protein J07HN4v3_02522 [Halonotius sp. J07HN4]